MGNITLNKPSGGQLTIAPEDGTSNETVSIPSVGVGKVIKVTQSNNIETANTTLGTAWTFAEASTNLRFSFTLASTNPLIKVTWVCNLEADGSNDRPFVRFYISKNGGSYTAGEHTHLLTNEATSAGQGGQAHQVVIDTFYLTANAGDTITISPYYASESGSGMKIQAGQDFTISTTSHYLIEEVAA